MKGTEIAKEAAAAWPVGWAAFSGEVQADVAGHRLRIIYTGCVCESTGAYRAFEVCFGSRSIGTRPTPYKAALLLKAAARELRDELNFRL